VIGGNERVVRPRLADAKFFFDQDRKKSLESRVPGLAKVVYHNKLGTQGERVRARCRHCPRHRRASWAAKQLAQQAEQAAVLAKADLLTDMVGEFPELQGIMGRYYALHDGEPAEVADAIEDHYKPRFAGDELPRGMVGLVRRAGRQAGDPGRHVRHRPDADRRQGPVRAAPPCAGRDPHADRARPAAGPRSACSARRHWSVDKVVSKQQNQLSRFHLRAPRRQPARAGLLGAGSRCRGRPAAAAPGRHPQAPGRRARLRRAARSREPGRRQQARRQHPEEGRGRREAKVDNALLKEAAEVALHAALVDVVPQADAAFERGDYTASLQALAALKRPVDSFFDDVMVNAEDAALRANRLGLLATLHRR
jgi:glycyl-tRNA synthetase beta chain